MVAKAMGPATLDQPQLLKAMRSLRRGDFTDRLPLDLTGIAGDIAEAFNDVVELNQRMAKEMARIESVVGRDGRITQRAALIGKPINTRTFGDQLREFLPADRLESGVPSQ